MADEMNDDLFPEGETEQKDMAEEPYGAQVLRRMHKDHSILMKDYDEMSNLLEDFHPVKAHLTKTLQGHERLLGETEKHFAKHYKNLPPLEDALDDEHKDLDEGEGLEDGPEGEAEEFEEEGKDMETDGEAVEEAPSDNPDEVPAEEAVEGMEEEPPTKSLRRKRTKALCNGCKGKKAEEVPVPHGDLNSGEGVPPSEWEPGAGAKALEPHETSTVGEAAGFLKDISEPYSEFGDEHRMKSYHYHKALGAIGDVAGAESLGGDAEVVPGEEADAHKDLEEGHKAFDKEGNDGRDVAYKQGYGAGRARKPKQNPYRHGDPRFEAWEDGYKDGKDGFPSQVKSDPGTPEWAAEEATEPEHMEEAPPVAGGEKSWHKARKHCKDASDFFKDLSQVQAFNDDYRAKALHHHKALDGIVAEGEAEDIQKGMEGVEDGPPGEEAAFEPGEMGEKAYVIRKPYRGMQAGGGHGGQEEYWNGIKWVPDLRAAREFADRNLAQEHARTEIGARGWEVTEKSLKSNKSTDEDEHETKRLKDTLLTQNRKMVGLHKTIAQLTKLVKN